MATSGDKRATPHDQQAAPLEDAREVLRTKQQKWAERLGAPVAPDAHGAAIADLAERMDPKRRVSDDVIDGPFLYPLATEQQRWDRTRQLIERTQPGPYEDGGFLGALARQAASVELTILDMLAEDASELEPSIADTLSMVVIGTVGAPTSSATTSRLKDSNATSIAMSAGMMYLLYQAAKADVLSWRPVSPPDESGVTFSFKLADAIAIMDDDTTSVDQLAETFVGWFLRGIPRPEHSTMPPVMYHPPLTLLIAMAERWFIAHEYCHALFEGLRHVSPSWLPVPSTAFDKEFRADLFATVVLLRSAWWLDRMPPNIAVQGAALAMKVHEIADRAIDIARGGRGEPAWRSTSHPPYEERAAQTFEAYAAVVGNAVEELPLDTARFVSSTLDELWRRAQPRVMSLMSSDAELHPIWRA